MDAKSAEEKGKTNFDTGFSSMREQELEDGAWEGRAG